MKPLKVTSFKMLEQTVQNYATMENITPENLYHHYQDYEAAKRKYEGETPHLTRTQLVTGIIITTLLSKRKDIELISKKTWSFKQKYATVTREESVGTYDQLESDLEVQLNADIMQDQLQQRQNNYINTIKSIEQEKARTTTKRYID